MENQFAELFSVTGHNLGAFWGWTVILAPPSLIRFAFLKRPVSKTMAVTISAVLWIINVIAMAAMGQRSKRMWFWSVLRLGLTTCCGSVRESLWRNKRGHSTFPN